MNEITEPQQNQSEHFENHLNSPESSFESQPSSNNHRFQFLGQGSQLFIITIVNFFLTLITLGVYYPWAKATRLKYMYQNTEFAGSRFAFHGTGKEMFKGFIIVLIAYWLFMALYIYLIIQQKIGFAIVLMVFVLLTIIPVAIHGSLKYRLARTSWRGIFMGYRGDLFSLYKIWLKGVGLSSITFGIYSFWMRADLQNYILDKVRIGNNELEYRGRGVELFIIAVLHSAVIFGAIIVIGITVAVLTSMNMYDLTGNMFIYLTAIYIVYILLFVVVGGLKTLADFKYNIQNTYLWQNQKSYNIYLNTSVKENVFMILKNFGLVIITLGIGISWATVNVLKYLYNRLEVDGEFNLNEVYQTEENFKNAAGDSMADFLDVDLV